MQIFKRVISYIIFCTLLTPFVHSANIIQHSKKQCIPHESITTVELNKADQKWFENSFVETFLNGYKPLTFNVGPKENPKTLGPNDTEDKRKFLEETAKEEFENYVVNPKESYVGIKILVDGKPAGAILLRLIRNGKIIYLARLFICEEFARKGLATYVLKNELRKKFPGYKRYEVLTRYENRAGNALNKRLQYTEDKSGKIAEFYGYNPERYMGFYKEFE